MSKSATIQKLESAQIKQGIPNFRVGDTVKVHVRIIEGSKERIQVFQGTVISRKGTGLGETFTVHRVAYGEGMERTFLINSPRISKIEIARRGQVRRSKLYYLRGTKGKKAKVKGSLSATLKDANERKAALAEAEEKAKEQVDAVEAEVKAAETPTKEEPLADAESDNS